MRFVYILSIISISILILAQNAMAGTFKEMKYQLEGKVSYDDNFGQIAPASQTAQNTDMLYSGEFKIKNTYVIDKDWEVPFTLGVAYNQYAVHSNSSFAAVKGSIKLSHDIDDKFNVSATYAANDYAKLGIGVNELANYAYVSARYKMQDNLSLYTNLGANWLINTNIMSYSGGMVALGATYTLSPLTVFSIEDVLFSRGYNGGRNDTKNEIILGLYQGISKNIVGVVNYYGINNSSTDPIAKYNRNIFSIGVRYDF